jgi:hypothetical protein
MSDQVETFQITLTETVKEYYFKPKVDFSEVIDFVEDYLYNKQGMKYLVCTFSVKHSSKEKLMYLRKNKRDFFQIDDELKLVFTNLLEDELEASDKSIKLAEEKVRNIIVKRFENPNVYIKPLDSDTVKQKLKEGQPPIPGVATGELYNDIKTCRVTISFSSNVRKKKKVNLPSK